LSFRIVHPHYLHLRSHTGATLARAPPRSAVADALDPMASAPLTRRLAGTAVGAPPKLARSWATSVVRAASAAATPSLAA